MASVPMIGRTSHPRYRDRRDAGRTLARLLREHAHGPDTIVLALPRGGVPVGYEVAHALGARLDVLIVRKLGVPGQEDLALGAIASGGQRVLNKDILRLTGLTDSTLERIADLELKRIADQERTFRGNLPTPVLRDRTVVLVDDGLATGATMRVAARVVRTQHPRRVVVAVPVSSRDACASLRTEVDEVVCAATPEPFCAVGTWYTDFAQTTDDEVRNLLARAQAEALPAARSQEAG